MKYLCCSLEWNILRLFFSVFRRFSFASSRHFLLVRHSFPSLLSLSAPFMTEKFPSESLVTSWECVCAKVNKRRRRRWCGKVWSFRLLNFKFRSCSFRSSFPFSPCFCGYRMESFTRCCVFFLFDLMSAGENSKFSGICRASRPNTQR